MSKIIIPDGHYFHKPTAATPEVFNRVFDDINNGFSKLWDGEVSASPELPFAILNADDTLSPATIDFKDTTFWPATVSSVNVSFALEGGTPGSLNTYGDVGQGGSVTWTPGTLTYATFTDLKVKLKMTASYDVTFTGTDTHQATSSSDKTITLSHPVSDPSTLRTFINGVECTHDSVAPGATTVTISAGETVTTNDTLSATYDWVISNTKEAICSCLVLPAAKEGADSVTAPIPQIHSASDMSILSDLGTENGSDVTLTDSSLTNDTDTITRQWTIQHATAGDVTNDTSYVELQSGSFGSALPAGGGSSAIVPRFKKSGVYTIGLNLHSTNENADFSTNISYTILDVWNAGAVVIDPTYDHTASPFVPNTTNSFRIEDRKPDQLDPNNYYSAPGTKFNKANVIVPLMNVGHNVNILGVVKNDFGGDPNDIYEVQLPAAYLSSYDMAIGDIVPGTNVFYKAGYPYEITGAVDSSGDLILSIKNSYGSPTPNADPVTGWAGVVVTTSYKDWGIGVLADSWVVRLEHFESSSGNWDIDYREIFYTPGQSRFGFAHFSGLPYGGSIRAYVYARHGNVLSASGVLEEVSLNVVQSKPSISGVVPDTSSVPGATALRVTASNAMFYDIGLAYDPSPTSMTIATALDPASSPLSQNGIYLEVDDVVSSGVVYIDGRDYLVVDPGTGSEIEIDPTSSDGHVATAAELDGQTLIDSSVQSNPYTYAYTNDNYTVRSLSPYVLLPIPSTVGAGGSWVVTTIAVDKYGRRSLAVQHAI